jgi:hypothetical protein
VVMLFEFWRGNLLFILMFDFGYLALNLRFFNFLLEVSSQLQ